MIARLLLSPNPDKIKKEILKILAVRFGGIKSHPDVLYFERNEKLGIAQVRKIKEHFSLKPFSATGRGVVLEDTEVLTIEAQNALLKTLEEPPKDAVLILGAGSTANLLPTVLSRCQIIHLQDPMPHIPSEATPEASEAGFAEDIKKLLSADMEERFNYVETLKNREEFLYFLVKTFRQMLQPPRRRCQTRQERLTFRPSLDYAQDRRLARLEVINFLKELLEAEEWAKQNVNIRAILEYLMLVMPKISQK